MMHGNDSGNNSGIDSDPRLKRSLRILIWSVIGVIAAYVVLSVILALCTDTGFFDGWFVLLCMGLVGSILVPILLAVANFVRRCVMKKYGSDAIPDPRLDKVLSIVALIGGVLTVVLFCMDFFLELELAYPWDASDVHQQFRGFALACFWICIVAMLVDFLAQLLLKFLKKKRTAPEAPLPTRNIRICATVLLVLTLLGALLIPRPMGKYNDGGKRDGGSAYYEDVLYGKGDRGSAYYEAVLYDVVVWNRTHTFGGDPLPPEDQKTRVYFFPFNCYTYDAQWDMKH